jgi:hypothetical protein
MSPLISLLYYSQVFTTLPGRYLEDVLTLLSLKTSSRQPQGILNVSSRYVRVEGLGKRDQELGNRESYNWTRTALSYRLPLLFFWLVHPRSVAGEHFLKERGEGQLLFNTAFRKATLKGRNKGSQRSKGLIITLWGGRSACFRSGRERFT